MLVNSIKNWFRKPLQKTTEINEYSYEITNHNVDGLNIKYAQWQHPKESIKTFEQSIIDAYKKIIPKGSFVIDIGAHSGDTSLIYAVASGIDGTVLALEPNPYVFKVLKENTKLNDSIAKIIALNIAAAEEDKTYTFQYSDNGFCNGGNLDIIQNKKHHHNFSLDVEGKNLESILYQDYADKLKNLSLIKVDTEGYDYYVLKTLKNIIEKFRPTIICEFLRKTNQEERLQLWNFLNQSGYKVYLLEPQKQEAGEEITANDLMKHKHFDAICFSTKNN